MAACGQSGVPATGSVALSSDQQVSAPQHFSTPVELAPEQYYASHVVEIVDGDTIVAAFENRTLSLRLIGLDTPETYSIPECGGAEATAFLSHLIPPGTEIWLTRDIEPYDIYDRMLAYVYRASDGLFANLAMLKYGMASELSFGTNIRFLPHFQQAEAEARTNQLGVWGSCGGTDTPR